MKKEKQTILALTLQNAVFYSGKARPEAVLGKVLAREPGLKKDMEGVREEIARVVKDINSLSLLEQKKRLERLAPELLEKEVKKESLPLIPNARTGKVVTRFAPAPTGPLTLPQFLRAVSMSYLYAKKYKGKFYLRFDDTDPRNIKKEYYNWIIDDLKNCGIKPNKITRESEHLNIYYKYAETLIKKGSAYLCSCSAEKFRKLKLIKRECGCRTLGVKENLVRWQKALKGKYREGKIVVRLKVSMSEPNPVLRDPPLLRVISARHPLMGKKPIWPLYNYACAIEDFEAKITHIFRGKEHEHNTAVQNKIYSTFGWPKPTVINFGMIYLPGKKLHTRDIKTGIKEGVYSGWDDPRLPTIRAFLRRGFHPDTFKQLAVQCGLTKTDIRLSWENLEGVNRKVIDPMANRYSVVIDPVRISLKDVPEIKKARLDLHPDFPKRGKREIPIKQDEIYISKEDFASLREKDFRLKGFCNVKMKGKKGLCTGTEIVGTIPKIQWVSKPNIAVNVLTPEKELKGLGEPALGKLKPGVLIQMERVGFGRIDKVSKGKVTVCFGHP